MATVGPSTRTFMADWEGRSTKRYTVLGGPEQDIGIGYMIVDATSGQIIQQRRFWNSPSRGRLVDLYSEVLSNQEVDELFDFAASKEGFANAPLSYKIPFNQNQYDAVFSWHYTYGVGFGRSLNNIFRNTITKYKDNFQSGYADIFDVWTRWSTAQGVFYRGIYIRRVAEFMLFFGKKVAKNYLDTLTKGATTKQEAFNRVKNLVFGDGPIPPYTPSDNTPTNTSGRNGPEADTQDNNPQTDLNFDFEKINNNQDVLELDNVEVSWGSRTTALEDSDWIGLKQFLIYLCSTYYPQNLIPFAELIPVYTLDPPQNSNSFLDKQKSTQETEFIYGTNKFFGFSDEDTNRTLDQTNAAIQNDYFKSSTGLDYDRYRSTSEQLDKLLLSGGADLLTVDPFYEVSTSLNVPNQAGQEVFKQRGYGYKIYGSITLNPGLIDKELSKAGGIGFTSIEVDSGSTMQNAMSLVTIKLLDVQGNKFVDLNSPWSFILNGTTKQGGDFYFRYGWQLRVPKATVGTGDKFINTEDLNAQKFWNHPGWNLFDKQTKMFILNIASSCDSTITLTQSNDPDSFRTPGYLLEQNSGVFQMKLDRKLDPLKYIQLNLINPELQVNPNDGSITATLYFRTQSAVANCLSNLSGATNMYNLFSNTAAKTGDTNLLDFMTAFLQDNKEYINSLTSKKIDPNAVVDPSNVRDWIQVIGGSSTTSQINIDPIDIPIKIPEQLLGELNRTYQSKRDTRLLLEWLNEVLDKNDCKVLTIGDQNIGSNVNSGSMVIVYEKEMPHNSNVTNADQVALLTTSGSTRLQLQDDVFSFRFRGSLVESLGIEKLESTSAQQNEGLYNLANEVNNTNDDNNTVMGKDKATVDKQVDQQVGSKPIERNDKNISMSFKKFYLASIYSQMAKASIKAIAHPWIKIGKAIYVKGTGFFDGRYIVTKVTHRWELDNKFVSEIDAMRVLNQDDFRKKQIMDQRNQNYALNNPGVLKCEPVPITPPLIPKDPYVVNKIIIGAPNPIGIAPTGPNTEIPIQQTIQADANAALALKMMNTAYNERFGSKQQNLDKYKNFINVSSLTDYEGAFLSWVQYKATYAVNEPKVFIQSISSKIILNQFKSRGRFRGFSSSVNYIPKKGDITFWDDGHIGFVYSYTVSKITNGTQFQLDTISTVELVDNVVMLVNRRRSDTNGFTHFGSNLSGFGVI